MTDKTTKCLRCNGAGSLQVDEPECNGGRTREACERCGGAGWVMNLDPFNSVDRQCTACDGHGQVGGFVGSIGSGSEGYHVETCSNCGGNGLEPIRAQTVANPKPTNPKTSRELPPGFGKGDCLTDRQKAERDVLLFGYGFLMVTSEGEQWLPVEAVAVRTDMVKARGI